MKCVLAAMGFINEDIRHNKNVILDTMKRYSGFPCYSLLVIIPLIA